ncbi:hypothetical protein RHODOSMS8_02201 [Rhodobiaceae bacterium]|nr:hypothetical protein RHODOSMS8_02201 [Rhodobiaceae bacterium]
MSDEWKIEFHQLSIAGGTHTYWALRDSTGNVR